MWMGVEREQEEEVWEGNMGRSKKC
jgi:hypothetical protein